MNNPLPKKHEDFIQWAKNISEEMRISSKGALRIGHNKLAAIMAKQLPGVTDSFNINALKSLFDSLSDKSFFSEAMKATIKENLDFIATKNQDREYLGFQSTLDNAFIELTRREMVTYLTQVSEDELQQALESGEAAYNFLDRDYDVANFFDADIDLNDDDYLIISTALPIYDSERLNSAYRERVAHLTGKEYGYIQYKTTCFAFIDYMKDSLYCFLDAMSNTYEMIKNISEGTLSHIYDSPVKVKEWVISSAKNWDEDGKVTGKDQKEIIREALSNLIDPKKELYTVTVRANLYGDGGILQMYELPESWQCYETSPDLENASVTMHCDTILEVMASSKEEALNLGKEKAEFLDAPEGIEVSIWCDERIDAVLAQVKLYAPF